MHTFLSLPYSLALLLPLLLSPLSTLSQADANNERLNSFSILDNNSIDLSDKTIEANITPTEYTYLMAITLKGATPDHDQHIHAVPDTGSHFIWLKKCKSNDADITTTTTSTSSSSCIQEKPAAEQVLKCDSSPCKNLKKIHVEPLCSPSHNCMYNVIYGDGFTSRGELTKGNKLSFPIIKNKNKNNIVVSGKDAEFIIKFGLSTEWKGPFEDRSAGIVGLGKGEQSLFKQISRIYKIPYKFSYCLPQYYHHHNSRTRSHGKLIFGKLVTVTPENSIRLDRIGSPLLYSVHLQSIFVGVHEIKVKVGGINKMVIDSGSTFTCLADHDLFTEFLSKVEEKVGKDSIETKYYDHCYKEENAKGLEKISLQFGGEGEGGKGIELKRENFFDVYKIEKENNIEEYLCLTVVDGTKKKHEMRVRGRGKNNDEMVHLLGSRAQMNFRVAFDITGEDHKVSFDKQENCGKEEEKKEGESMVFQE